jgi:hypothetical protein
MNLKFYMYNTEHIITCQHLFIPNLSFILYSFLKKFGLINITSCPNAMTPPMSFAYDLVIGHMSVNSDVMLY